MCADIKIPEPMWGSELTKTIMALEKLRQPVRYSSVPPYIFLQLKKIFQLLETLGSARIEGNNTTLSEYVEKKIDSTASKDEQDRELDNIDECIHFIEDNVQGNMRLDRAFLSEIHKILTKELTPPPDGEGSHYPGELRKSDVTINGVKPPPPVSFELLQEYFNSLISFINQECSPQNQLLMVSIAHHRFMYVHPFDNGNGRVGRLLNYALLVKLGFNVKGSLLNPSSVFYTNRDMYYKMLAKADSLEESGLLEWASYFLNGLKDQLEKIEHITDQKYTVDKILLPTVKYALERQHITKQEADILSFIIKHEKMAIQSKDLSEIGISSSSKKAYAMRKLREKGMATPIKGKERTYTIRFVNNYLLRSVIKVLEENGFIAEFLNENAGKRRPQL